MKEKSKVRKKIKLLSWTSLISLLTLLSIFSYNSYSYLSNLKNVKTIVEMVDQNTSQKLKEEVIATLSSNIESSQMIIYLLLGLGVVFIITVIYLGRTIKKEISKKIHAMDWIIE